MKITKVRILEKNEKFISEVFDFSMGGSSELLKIIKRDNLINEIINNKKDISLLQQDSCIEIIRNLSPILLDNKYGSIYQSKYREVIDLTTISHHIKYLTIENNTLFGIVNILDTPMGKPIQSINPEDMLLKPIYNHAGEIITFDIDFKIRKSA